MIKRLFCSKLGLILIRLFKVMWKIQFFCQCQKKLSPLPACDAQFCSMWLWPPTFHRHGERCLSAQVTADALVFWKRHNKCAPSTPPTLVLCLMLRGWMKCPLLKSSNEELRSSCGPSPSSRTFFFPGRCFDVRRVTTLTSVSRWGANDDVKPRSNQVV